MSTITKTQELDTHPNNTYNQTDVERIVSSAVGQAIAQYEARRLNLENCTDEAQITSKEVNHMAVQRQRVIVGFNEDKTPRYKYITGSTQDERDIEVVKAFIESGRIYEFLPTTVKEERSTPKHKFSDYAWYWYKTYKEPGISTKYKGTLQGRIKRLCSYFGQYAIEDITTGTIQTWLSTLTDMTKGTVGYYRNAISQILESAMEDGYISHNPAKSKRIKVGGTEATGRQSLSMDDCKRLMKMFKESQYPKEVMALALMLYAGLRREEMLGLQWQDIDFDRKIIHIERAVIIGNDGKSEIKVTKNKSSRRPIPMADVLIDILKPHRQIAGFLVTNDDGELFIDRQYKKFWQSIREHTGMPNLDARQLRHTYATMHAAAGVDIKTVGAYMGHSKIATTAEIYTQVEPIHAMKMRNQMYDYVQRNIAETP